MADEDPIDLIAPPSGTNWNCATEMDLKQIAQMLRHYRADLIRQGDWNVTCGKIIGFIAFLLAILNGRTDIAIIKLLLPIFVGIGLFWGLQDVAVVAFDTAFELQAIIDAIRSELNLPRCSRIDGSVFLRTVEMDRNAALNEYRDATIY
jgi:hypothetical protein